MPLARSLTKKLQKLRSRANSEATSPLSPPTGATGTGSSSGSGGPGAGATDYFYSISFDQTQSATISPTSSQASLSTAGSPMSPDTPSGDLTVHAQRIYASSSANLQKVTDTTTTTTMTSSTTSSTPTTLSQSQKDLTSTVAAKLQQYPGGNSTGSEGPSRSASQKSTKSQASSVYSHSVNQQQQHAQVHAPETVELFISNADGSIEPVHYKEEVVEDPIEARADEMAMNILEKVSADDYVREIKAGSWYIS